MTQTLFYGIDSFGFLDNFTDSNKEPSTKSPLAKRIYKSVSRHSGKGSLPSNIVKWCKDNISS